MPFSIRLLPVLAALSLLAACSLCPHGCGGPVHEPERRSPEVGFQVWNDSDRTIICVAIISATHGDPRQSSRRTTLEIPPSRGIDPALGGDPRSSRTVSFPVEFANCKVRLQTPAGAYDGYLHPGDQNWVIANVGRDSFAVMRDTGPRYLE